MKWRCRFSLGVSPSLFYPCYRVYYQVNASKIADTGRFTEKDTELVIEGFPRSANSSTVAHFQSFNPQVKLAHHHHVPAQVLRAVRFGIPAIVLIRTPEEAISSFKCFEPELPLLMAIEGHCSFYRTLFPYAANFTIAPFERLFEDFDGIIDRVNGKFATRFSIGVPLLRQMTNREAKIPYLKDLQESRYRVAMDSAFRLHNRYLTLERETRQQIVRPSDAQLGEKSG